MDDLPTTRSGEHDPAGDVRPARPSSPAQCVLGCTAPPGDCGGACARRASLPPDACWGCSGTGCAWCFGTGRVRLGALSTDAPTGEDALVREVRRLADAAEAIAASLARIAGEAMTKGGR